jgi:hypothetical protein
MVEAVRMTASPLDIWIMVVVVVLVLAFWLSAIYFADHIQARASGRFRAEMTAAEARREAREGEAPTRLDARSSPARPTGPARPEGGFVLPAPRSGEADQAARSYAGPRPPEEDDGQ